MNELTEINISTEYKKLHLACSTDMARESINAVYMDSKEQKAIATNGRIMAIVPAAIDGNSCKIPVDAFKSNISKAKKKDANSNIQKNGTIEVITGSNKTLHENPANDSFPNWKWVTPKEVKNNKVKVSFDIKQLTMLANSIGSDGKVVLHLDVEDNGENINPIMVTCEDFNPYLDHSDKAKGVLMSCRL